MLKQCTPSSLAWLTRAAIQQINEGPAAEAAQGATALHELLHGTAAEEAAANLALLHAKAREAAGKLTTALELLTETVWP